ncbi:hypothetical protein BKH41_05130 [Helicobacter sp. 12S02232-10]|uniref:hypothetical protein n=1 Tax=Helicobacter sp. 12S02232-10 TaxID=1476197 RepID=UPI000BA4F2BC|nr:hypothetical protein [Helicobacter sp. 12S02232-10]PAF48654.1 hypothetical protein BKH41_05130 [Helicobacter sp. 12S02232-10]
MEVPHQIQIESKIVQARILYYDFFSGLFLFELLKNRQELLKKQISILKNFALKESDLENFLFLENELLKNGIKNFLSEFTLLFSLPFSNEEKKPVYLYISHYQENCIGGKSLVAVKEIIKKSHYFLNDELLKESEENLGFLFVAMRRFLEEKEIDLAKELFIQCIYPIKNPICKAIAQRKDCFLYTRINDILEEFLNLEESIFSN